MWERKSMLHTKKTQQPKNVKNRHLYNKMRTAIKVIEGQLVTMIRNIQKRNYMQYSPHWQPLLGSLTWPEGHVGKNEQPAQEYKNINKYVHTKFRVAKM
jgi:hypothetical protein